jgi:hypothetical protein
VTYVGTRRFWLCDDVVLCGKSRTGGKQKYKMTALFRLAPDASAVATHGAVNEKDLVHCFQIVSFARDAESLVLGFESERSRDEWFSTLQSLLRKAFERQRERTAASQAAGDAKLAGGGAGAASGGGGASSLSPIEAMDDAQRAALSDADVRGHLTAAFCEFVTSETTYVEQLSMCVRRYLRPLRTLHMQASELTHLFEAIERIVPVHAKEMLPCVASINPNADADVGASETRLQAALAKAVDELASNFDAHTQHAQMLDAGAGALRAAQQPRLAVQLVCERGEPDRLGRRSRLAHADAAAAEARQRVRRIDAARGAVDAQRLGARARRARRGHGGAARGVVAGGVQSHALCRRWRDASVACPRTIRLSPSVAAPSPSRRSRLAASRTTRGSSPTASCTASRRRRARSSTRASSICAIRR